MHYIYKHTNKINGKCYIGQTKNIKSRWRVEGYKYCRKFYRAIIKYGWINFEHEILKECSSENVDYWESYYISFYDSIKNGYNLESGGCVNKKVSEETKKLISEAGKGRVSYFRGKEPWNKGLKMSDDYRQKLSNAHKGKKGKPCDIETRKKISQAQIGKKISDETRKKLSISHKGKPSSNKGRTFNEEWRRNLSLAHLGKKPIATMKKICNITIGEIFESITEAANKYKISRSHISTVCKGKRKTVGGFEWKYI